MSAEIEPVRGLPEALPAGETILWQGAPDWRRLAVTAFHVRKVAIYFGLLGLWRVLSGLAEHEAATAILSGLFLVAGIAALGVCLLCALAWLAAKATVYTITTRRVVLRFGTALPLAVNVPFRIVRSAGLRLSRDGSGDIPLALAGDGKISYVALWPHARPWRFAKPEPMLRAIPAAAKVADILAEALQDEASPALVQRPLPAAPAADIAAAAA